MDLELASESEWLLEAIISVFVPAVAAVVGVLVLWIGGTELAARVRATARSVRKYVDESDDFIIVAIDGAGEWMLHRTLDAAIISRLLTATVDAIGKPPQEVAVGDTPK